MNSHSSRSEEDPPELVYIMGTGRSGTTVLEILLHNNPGLFGAGELFNLLQDGYLKNVTCSCGKTFDDCEVWSRVKGAMPLSDEDCRRLAAKARQLEWHWGLFRLILGRVNQTDEEEYAALNRALLHHLQGVTRAERIIDSSKYCSRAMLLSRAMPGRVRVIWLTRSPGEILASFRKPNKIKQRPKSTFSAMCYIIFITVCAWIVRRKLGKSCLHVRYEDLQADTERELARIGEWAGCNLSNSAEIVKRDGLLEVGHIITGNRLIKQGRIVFQTEPTRPMAPSIAIAMAENTLGLWYRFLGL